MITIFGYNERERNRVDAQNRILVSDLVAVLSSETELKFNVIKNRNTGVCNTDISIYELNELIIQTLVKEIK